MIVFKVFKLTVAVDPNSSSTQALDNVVNFIDVLREHGCSESVFGVVRALDDFIQFLKANDLLDRSKDFFLGNGHVIADIREDSWLDEESFAFRAFSACNELCALLLA